MIPKRVTVLCAIITFGDKTLVVQRSKTMNHPLKWEFPGGKIEPNETEIDCILREIKEELDIEITPLKKLKSSTFEYPNIAIELIPYLATYKCGIIKLKEHKQYKLLKKEELVYLDWAEADLPIVKELLTL
jgi:8-oxo-dGTP diphosphatase